MGLSIFLIESFSNKKIISDSKHITFEMPKKRSIDLDDYQDLEITRELL